MPFTEATFDRVKVFHLKGKIMGGPETQAVCDRLKELIASGTQSLVMDFSQARWINSNGIGVVMACLTSVRNSGGDVCFANLHGATQHYFRITKLDTVVNVFDSVDEAIASFAKA